MKETTITLDVDAVDSAEHLARAWGVSVPEAIKRALKSAASSDNTASNQAKLQAFLELSQSLNLDEAKLQTWMNTIREARR